jgi:hypothetical protein
MSETLRRLNLEPCIPLDLTVLNSPDDAVGPGPRHSSHLAHWDMRELFFILSNHEGKKAGSLIARQVSTSNGLLRLLLDIVGPSLKVLFLS